MEGLGVMYFDRTPNATGVLDDEFLDATNKSPPQKSELFIRDFPLLKIGSTECARETNLTGMRDLSRD